METSMGTIRQKTVGKAATLSGIGLHAGDRATLTVKPAAEGSGICFVRVDRPGRPQVRALATNVVDVRRGTTIKSGDCMVFTVEHVMAALHAAGVDNALVEMDGPEPPIADGSAQDYWALVMEAGVVEQSAPAEVFAPAAPLCVQMGATKLAIFPDDCLRVTCVIDFGATPLDAQYYSDKVTPELFGAELAPARTFVVYKDLEQLIGMGLVKGGSLDNAIIIHDGAVISKEGLRYPNELARHKALDVVGDIFLVGKRVVGHVVAYKPGHPANVALAGKMIEQEMQAKGN